MASKKNSKLSKPNYQGSLADYKASVNKPKSITPPIISAPTVYQAANAATKTAKSAAVDLALMAAGGGIGKVLAKGAGKLAARFVAGEAFETLAPRTIGAGGKVSKTNIPMGPTLRSTRIMTQGQQSAAGKGLTKIASNRANEIGAQIGIKVSEGTVSGGRLLGQAAAAAPKPHNKKAAEKKLETAKKAKQKGR